MKKEISLIKSIVVSLDFVLFFFALALTLFFRFGLDFSIYFKDHFMPFLFLFPFYLFFLFSFNLYDFYFLNLKIIIFRIFYFSFASLILSIAYFYFGETIFEISPKTNLIIFFSSFIFLIFVSRLLIFKIFQRRKINVYFLGREILEDKLKEDLQNHPFFVFKGSFKKDQGFQNNFSSQVVIVIDHKYNLKMDEFHRILNLDIAVFGFIEFYERFLGRIPLEAITPDWFLRELVHGESKVYLSLKRILDVVISLIILIFIFLPLFLPIALLIFISDPGPIFYIQERVGYKGKTFRLVKFRTMRKEQVFQQKWAVGDERKRIFLFGKFLRNTHLDELPQVFNLLKGDLTLVGPRPEQPEIFYKLEKEIPFYFFRAFVLPGLTGWAQVNYKYPENIEETKIKLEYDFYYLKNANIFLDFLIIIKTSQKLLTF